VPFAVGAADAWPEAETVAVTVGRPPGKVALAPEPGAANVTAPPETGSAPALVTATRRGAAKAVPRAVLCGVPALAVAVKPRDSKAPASQRAPWGRATPRASAAGHPFGALNATPSSAGLPGRRANVGTGPPQAPRGETRAFTGEAPVPTRSPAAPCVSPVLPVPSPTTLFPPDVKGPARSGCPTGEELPATIVFASVTPVVATIPPAPRTATVLLVELPETVQWRSVATAPSNAAPPPPGPDGSVAELPARVTFTRVAEPPATWRAAPYRAT
jgi:hypothetical protein